MKQLTMGSLFDGSGGFPLASQIVGIKPVWASEIEPFPIQVTKSRFPDMKHLGSVTDIKQTQIVCCERLVRSLTPLECNRLQGFPEGWTDNLTTDDPEFWRKVYDTWCDINGKKRKTDKQIKKLVDSCGTDSARYRMWGEWRGSSMCYLCYGKNHAGRNVS